MQNDVLRSEDGRTKQGILLEEPISIGRIGAAEESGVEGVVLLVSVALDEKE